MSHPTPPSSLNASQYRTHNQAQHLPYFRTLPSSTSQPCVVSPQHASSPQEAKHHLQAPHKLAGQHSPFQYPVSTAGCSVSQLYSSDRSAMNPHEACFKQNRMLARHEVGSLPTVNQISKPKIVFSYNQSSSEPPGRLTMQPNSCQSSSLLGKCHTEDAVQNGIPLAGSLKRVRSLRICSNEISHFFIPKKVSKNVKRTSSLSRDKYFRTAQPNKKFFKTSGTGFPLAPYEPRRTKESKIASTEATRSFQGETDNADPSSFSSSKETTFDFSSIKSIDHKLPLIRDSLQPSELLKKTMTFSKYNFGGLISQPTGSCRAMQLDQFCGEEGSKWKSYVKCLFDGEEDLKQSIHCGPDTRGDHLTSAVLKGFGRQIAESCISDTEHFQ